MEDYPAPAPPASPSPEAPAAQLAPRSPGRFWVAAAVGTTLSGLFGWFIMPFLASVMYVLGLFFFMLVGLIIGALTYRLAAPAAPIARRRLMILGIVMTLAMWVTTLIGEYRFFPTMVSAHVQRMVLRSLGRPLTTEQAQTINTEVRAHVAAEFGTKYAPGGLLGYMRWCLVSGEMRVPRAIDSSTIHFELSQRRVWWTVRVVFSLILLGGAFLSQLLPLGPPVPESPEGPEPEKSEC